MNSATWDIEIARRRGNITALIIGEKSWTNAQLCHDASRFAAFLIHSGLSSGERVVVALPNSRELFVVALATGMAGGVLVVLGETTPERTLKVVDHCGASVLVANAPTFTESRARVIFLAVGGSVSPETDLDSLIDRMEPLAAAVERDASEPAQLCYTSGVTGAPKAVVFTHGGINLSCSIRDANAAADALIELLAFPPTAFGARFLGLRAVKNATYVVLSHFEPALALRAIEQHRVKSVVLLPTMAEQLAVFPEIDKYDYTSLDAIHFGGSAVSTSLTERLRQQFTRIKNLRMFVHYGMTETGGGITKGPLVGEGVVGSPVQGATFQILDSDDREVPSGQIGEVVARTSYTAVGYWQDPQGTAEVFKNGAVYTGDLGYITSSNELCLVGRKKELIIQGSHNIYPNEVANVIRKLRGVSDCGVIGIPDELVGEALTICIVPEHVGILTESLVREHCRQFLDRRKQPSLVYFVDEIPRTSVGKINLPSLRELISQLDASVSGPASMAIPRDCGREERQTFAEKAIRSAVVTVLGERIASQRGTIEGETPLGELGLDSLDAVWLSRLLAKRHGVRAPSTLMYSRSTINAIRDWFEEQFWGASVFPPAEPNDKGALRADAADIAVVGVGCRLPGNVEDPAAFWQFLEQGKDAVREAPDWRRSGTDASLHAAFVEGVDRFDADFFRLSSEAVDIDPQHRMLLETTWEALEDAGSNPRGGYDGSVGVFLGIYGRRYEGADLLGSSSGMAVSRLSHFFDFHGPVVSIDTTCSSSLVAVHHARQSLRAGECDVAVVGGVNLLSGIARQDRLGVLSRDGRSKAFDARADGFGQGEGCVVLILKRLGDARSGGDRIYAVIRGSAINHDGRSASLTAPNPAAQAAVIRSALKTAGMHPQDVQYVEAHGTGTLLGDPIEIEGLSAVFSSPRGAPLAVGSVKTNIGHLEAGAGIAGLLKAVLAIHHRKLPASLNCSVPNPHIPWDRIPIRVQTSDTPWPEPGKPLVAGVSSFGMSGTNAHVIVSEGPSASSRSRDTNNDFRNDIEFVLPLSAVSVEALRAGAERYVAALQNGSMHDSCRDIAYSASCRRSHLPVRLAVVGKSHHEWIEGLRNSFAMGHGAIQGKYGGSRGTLAMIFNDDGEAWWGMGHHLMREEPIFRSAIERCAAEVERQVGWALVDELGRDENTSRIGSAEVAQPAIFSLQAALYELWRSWGITPDAVAGHGVGEIAAGYASGAFSLEHAVRASLDRGKAYRQTAERAQDVFERLRTAGHTLFIEVGPHPSLLPAISPESTSAGIVVLSSLRKGMSERRSMLESLGRLYEIGYPVSWKKQYTMPGQPVELPRYPWQRRSYWIGSMSRSTDLRSGLPSSTPAAVAHVGGVDQESSSGSPRLMSRETSPEASFPSVATPVSGERFKAPSPMAPSQDGSNSSFGGPIDADVAKHGLHGALLRQVARVANVESDRIGENDTLEALGIDSLGVIRLRSLLLESTGVELRPSAFSETSSIKEISEFLDTQVLPSRRASGSCKVPLAVIRAEGAGPPCIWIHPVGGGIECYRLLSGILAFRSIAISSPLLHPALAPDYSAACHSIEAMAERYIQELSQQGIQETTLLGGWSLGGLIAREMASQWPRDGRRVPPVVMIDSYSRGMSSFDSAPSPQKDVSGEDLLLREFLAHFGAVSLERVPEVTPANMSGTYGASGDSPSELLLHARALLNQVGGADLLRDIVPSDFARLFEAYRVNAMAMRRYRLTPYAGRTLSVRARSSHLAVLGTPSEFGGHCTERVIDGDHYSIMSRPGINELANVIEEEVRALKRASTTQSLGSAGESKERSSVFEANESVAGWGLSGRVVLVTGSSRGIGRATAEAFAAAGARVTVTYRKRRAAAEEVVDAICRAGGDATCTPLDLADPASIQQAVKLTMEKWRRLDVLVNNALDWPYGDASSRTPIEDAPLPEWQNRIRANIEGAIAAIQAVIPSMRANGWGRIVSLSSVAATEGMPGYAWYAAAKSALHGLTRTLAQEVGPAGILANVVMAGPTLTSSIESGFTADQLASIAARNPIRRIASPRDVAEVILFLCSERNSVITGEIIRASGGRR